VALVRERTIPTATCWRSKCQLLWIEVFAWSTDPRYSILGFLYRSRYYIFQLAPQLYSRGWVDPVPDPLLLRKSGSAGNRFQDTYDFIPLRTKYSPQHPVLRNSAYVLPLMSETKFHCHTKLLLFYSYLISTSLSSKQEIRRSKHYPNLILF
jgi:hypothetical protein